MIVFNVIRSVLRNTPIPLPTTEEEKVESNTEYFDTGEYASESEETKLLYTQGFLIPYG